MSILLAVKKIIQRKIKVSPYFWYSKISENIEMDESVENVKENTPPIYVLLPICIESKTDVFLNILKNVLCRSRPLTNFLDNAFISGIAGEKFHVDFDDISVDWKTLTSESRQIRQLKLLGSWAIRHYPSIGKKLIGGAWQPPKKCGVHVTGSTEMTEAEIDIFIFKKMKLRIIELNVSKSTSDKLKYFVRAPMTIGKMNVTLISPKMRAFDIENQYLKVCWQA